jgi:tape measure domain-containing protein
MSDVDKRVVQMDFDNKKFEKNVKQSTESLNTLKSSLNFDGVSNSIDQVTVKISKMEMVVASVISNITNRIVNLGIQLVKSLSIDNIASGWEKFGQKTTSVATLMAQTLKVNGQELTDVTEKLSTVNELMDKLMWFTDETSYSFTDMIDNIGKFTAAGLDLDVSTKAMEGIATWAALSGQNATTASRAMYQLSQAMGKGKIQLIDWKSIQNANMDTAEMRENVLETAVSLGQLTKEGNKYVTKSGKKFTQNQFTEELSEGWFTSEVLTKTLEKYSDATDEIYVIAQKEGLTASEVLEKYGDTLDEFGVKAFKAAQEARTLSDALNSVKDAVASKWMTTSELIFGDKDEAIELWTDLANALYEVFAESGDFRNAILEVWNALGGREDLFKRGGDDQGAFWNIFDAIIAVKDVIKQAWNTIFPLSQMEDESDQAQEIGNTIKQLTSRFKEWTKTIKLSDASALKLQKVLEGVFTVLKGAFALLRAGLTIVSPIIDVLKQVASSVLDEIVTLIGKLNFSGEGLLSLADRIYEVVGTFFSDVVDIPKIIKTIINVVSTLAKVLGALIKRIYEFVKTSSLIKSAINIFKKLGAMLQKISPVFEKVGGVFTGFVEFVDNSIGALVSSNAISDVDKKVAKPIESALNGLASAINSILNATSLGSVDMSLLSPMAALFTGLYEVFKGAAGIIGILLSTIGRILQLTTKGLSALENIALNLETWQIALIAIGAFCAAMIIIIAVIVNNVKQIGYLLSSTIAPWGTFVDSLTGTLDGITRKMTGEMIKAIAEAVLAFTIATALLASINPDRLWPAVAAISVLAAVLSGIVVGFILIQNKLNKAKIKKERLSQTFASYMGIASALEAFSFAVLKIAVALYIMGKVDPGRLWSGMGVIGVIAALSIALAAFGKKSKNNLKKALPGIGQMLMIAALMKSIAKTLDMFKDINNGQRANLLVASAVMAAFMAFCTGFAAVMTFIANRMNFGSASKSISMLFGMVGLILAFGISVKMLASVPWNTTAVVMGVIGGFFVEFAGLVALITLAGKLSKKSKPQAVFREMIGMAVLLLAFGATINMLAKIPWSTSAVVLGIVGAFFIEFAGLVALISLSGKLSKKSKPQAVFREMIGMSALLLSFGLSVQILSKIEWATAGVMLGIIGAFFLEFAGLCILITQYGKSASRATFAMLAMSAMMLMFGVMINLMDSLDVGHMFASVGALAIAFVAMAALFAAIGSATKGLGKAVTAVAVITSMTAMFVAYTVMMKLLANVGIGQLFAVVGSLTALLIAFVSIAALMSKKASILIAA